MIFHTLDAAGAVTGDHAACRLSPHPLTLPGGSTASGTTNCTR